MNKQNHWLFEFPPVFTNTESGLELSDSDLESVLRPRSTLRISNPIRQIQKTDRSISVRDSSSRLSYPTMPGRVLTYDDVLSDRIDVHAQYALLRMSKNPAMSADAVGMAAAVKSGKLGGIYKEDQKVPALRARKMNSSWWLIIPKGEDAVLFLDPEKPKTGTPIIVFRDSVRSLPQRIDPALLKAWQTYKLQETGLQTGTVQQCGQITPSGVLMAKAFAGKPINNLTPSIFCFTGATPSIDGTTCICRPQRNVCPDCECKIGDSSPKCPSRPIVKRLSFQEMWNLIIRHYYCELPVECNCKACCLPLSKPDISNPNQLRNIFSPELLISIFWEETGFRNIPQLPGPATGFGQVEEGQFFRTSFCGIEPWTRQEILCEDKKSIHISGIVLWDLFCKSKSPTLEGKKKFALVQYTGADKRLENAGLPQKWIESEKRFKKIREDQAQGKAVDKKAFIEALNVAARSNAPFQPADDPCVFPSGQLPLLSYSCPEVQID